MSKRKIRSISCSLAKSGSYLVQKFSGLRANVALRVCFSVTVLEEVYSPVNEFQKPDRSEEGQTVHSLPQVCARWSGKASLNS